MKEEVDDLMLELQTEYREGLEERAAELESAWRKAGDPETWRTGVLEIINAAHKLNGSARVFGFGVISDRAEALETYAEMNRSRIDDAEGVRVLEGLYQELQRVIAETRNEVG